MRESGVNPALDTHGRCCVCGNSATFVANVSECGSVRESMHCTVIEEGVEKDGVVCQNLERLTFVDDKFDVVITED